MTLLWTDPQRASVEGTLARHPLTSARCADAAREILSVAREIDALARGRRVVPNRRLAPRARFVMPKVSLTDPWHHHVTVEASLHHVDALTGAEGHLATAYLAAFFEYPELHQIVDVDLSESTL